RDRALEQVVEVEQVARPVRPPQPLVQLPELAPRRQGLMMALEIVQVVEDPADGDELVDDGPLAGREAREVAVEPVGERLVQDPARAFRRPVAVRQGRRRPSDRPRDAHLTASSADVSSASEKMSSSEAVIVPVRSTTKTHGSPVRPHAFVIVFDLRPPYA